MAITGSNWRLNGPFSTVSKKDGAAVVAMAEKTGKRLAIIFRLALIGNIVLAENWGNAGRLDGKWI